MSTPTRPPQEAPADRRRRRLASYSVMNMVWSVLAVLGIVLVWWSLTYNPDRPEVRPVAVDVDASYAATQADWPVWVGEPGEGWTPTVAWYDTFEELPTWHMSWVSPEGRYVAVHQAADVTQDWLGAALEGATRDGEARLTGPAGELEWQRWSGRPGSNAEVAYVLGPDQTGGSTLVLHGTAGPGEMQAFLDSVQPRD